MTKTRWLMAAAGVAAAVALLAWAFAPRPVEVELAQAVQGRFETTVDEDGKTRLRERYVVSAPLAGRLERITLREGDAVEAGAVVATLAPALAPLQDERTLREQRARVEGAEANVARGAARIERAKVALQQARNELRRSDQLAAQGFVSPTQAETARLAALGAQKELDAATQERHIAEHELEQARAAAGAVRAGAASRAFVVRSPVAGRVLRVVQASEGVVALGTPLVEIGDTAQLEIVAELLTTDALRTPPGSRVIVERWGGPGTLAGTVRRIEPAAFTKVSALGVEEQRVRVLIDLTSPAGQWRALGDGYRVGVRIVTLAVADALTVPVSAVFPLPADAHGDAPARMAVFVVDGGRTRLVEVELGARNGVDAWLKAGLKPGATVIVYPPKEVRDGVRVRARKV